MVDQSIGSDYPTNPIAKARLWQITLPHVLLTLFSFWKIWSLFKPLEVFFSLFVVLCFVLIFVLRTQLPAASGLVGTSSTHTFPITWTGESAAFHCRCTRCCSPHRFVFTPPAGGRCLQLNLRKEQASPYHQLSDRQGRQTFLSISSSLSQKAERWRGKQEL